MKLWEASYEAVKVSGVEVPSVIYGGGESVTYGDVKVSRMAV